MPAPSCPGSEVSARSAGLAAVRRRLKAKWLYGSKKSRVFAPLRQMPGAPVAPSANRLPLLPSGPDGVHGALPHRTQRLTKRCKHARRRGRDLNPRGLSPYELSRPAHSARLCDLSGLKASAHTATWRRLSSKSRISIAKRHGTGKSGALRMRCKTPAATRSTADFASTRNDKCPYCLPASQRAASLAK